MKDHAWYFWLNGRNDNELVLDTSVGFKTCGEETMEWARDQSKTDVSMVLSIVTIEIHSIPWIFFPDRIELCGVLQKHPILTVHLFFCLFLHNFTNKLWQTLANYGKL